VIGVVDVGFERWNGTAQLHIRLHLKKVLQILQLVIEDDEIMWPVIHRCGSFTNYSTRADIWVANGNLSLNTKPALVKD